MVWICRARGAALVLGIWSYLYCSAWSASSDSQKCDEPLVAGLQTQSFKSSSVMSGIYAPVYAKLNRREGDGGWSPLDTDHYQWLQVDFGSRKQIRAIATQGRYSSSDWVSQYRLLYSDTGRNWKPYHQDGNIWAFPGNINSDTVVRHELQHPIVASYVRIVPLDWSGEGQIGLRVELYGCPYWADVINFDGNTVLSYQFKDRKMATEKDVISLKFKSTASEGVLFHGEGQQGDYITLELKRAKLVLQLNLGSNQYGNIYGHTTVTTGSLLDDHHWHSVIIDRHKKHINLTLDNHVQHFKTNGEFVKLDLDFELTFGGMPLSGKPSSSNRRNFKGCMESIKYNSLNITDLARRKKMNSYNVDNLSFTCAESHAVPVFFNATSYLEVHGREEEDVLSLSFYFRTWNTNGLLLFTIFSDEIGSIEIDLTEGKVFVHINITKLKKNRIDISSGSGLNDGQWHEVRFTAEENSAMLTIDGDEASSVKTNSPLQFRTGSQYFFGGTGFFSKSNSSNHPVYENSFQGCMQLLHVDNQLVDLHAVEQGKHGSFENITIDMCAIIDRCVPNNCEHGGKCTQTWDTITCNCEGTGYTGATCHNSMYELSCEVYRHLGNTSDFYWIDPDGSGPQGPLRVYCNMTEDKVWTTLYHDLKPETSVPGASKEKRVVVQLNYNTSMEQISTITNSAERCEQYVSYSCKMSRLLNSPDGNPYSWWVGKGNEKHYYWGNSGPGIQKCSCGIDRNCSDSRFYCNCDADQRQWRKDDGILSYKDHLPVTQVVVGDTYRSSSEAKLTVNPLRCYGDKNYWNAVSFVAPNSFLHFSTFQGETSADISFYFKTSAPDGVFVENRGNTDFIKIELKSNTEVSFSFDVGNGLVELIVSTSTPLNDDQWHRVRAERNIKEARLQVDQLPPQILKAPTHGHTRLELTSQFYVGAAGDQKGFLGCIRALRVNGIPLDLEERAKATQGVKPGCSGHCTSFKNLCRNGGTCNELYKGYKCDCSRTAYDGSNCINAVGGYFEEGTWLKYSFHTASTSAVVSPKDVFVVQQSSASDISLAKEELLFSFSTTKTPCILVYVSSYSQDYMAVLLKPPGILQIRYNLGGTKEPFIVDITDHKNLANGQPHNVNITRAGRNIIFQLDHYSPATYSLPPSSETQFNGPKALFLGRVLETGTIDQEIQSYNTPGFSGCLSRVQFNLIAPLKLALRSRNNSQVQVVGELVESNCGASPLTIPQMASENNPWHSETANFPNNEGQAITDGVNRNSAIIGGIIAVVIFTILCTLVFLIRYMFRHKGTYHTNEAKGAESADSADAAIINNDPNFTETIDESKKEWLI
ncbi:contactin-associated protein-like 2 [Bufo gargarizans]|uniref:contactin-associated protein-like 2 n=1 Tax=Bufo gargarizans TaxID=30331 RepID=UPI001CF1EA67|nr:contactin-associated protein-like 2 [Bufo gargarizans]